MENSRFIELYTELEIDIRRIYELRDNESPITYYLKEVITPRNEDAYEKLDQIRRIRNLLVHGNTISTYIPLVLDDSLEDDLVNFIERVNRFSYAKAIMTTFSNLASFKLNSKVINIIKYMVDLHFSYIPIIEDQKLIGIFSKDSVIELVVADIDISKELRVEDIKEYIRLCLKEIRFVKEDELIENVMKTFNSKKKIKYIIVTENGTINGKILGVISPSDIYKAL